MRLLALGVCVLSATRRGAPREHGLRRLALATQRCLPRHLRLDRDLGVKLEEIQSRVQRLVVLDVVHAENLVQKREKVGSVGRVTNHADAQALRAVAVQAAFETG